MPLKGGGGGGLEVVRDIALSIISYEQTSYKQFLCFNNNRIYGEALVPVKCAPVA